MNSIILKTIPDNSFDIYLFFLKYNKIDLVIYPNI